MLKGPFVRKNVLNNFGSSATTSWRLNYNCNNLGSLKWNGNLNGGSKIQQGNIYASLKIHKAAFSTSTLSESDLEKYKKLAEKGSPFAVIKVGGEVVEYELDKLVSTIKTLRDMNLTTVVIHGGGPQMNDELKRQNIVPEYIKGNRVTDLKTLEIARNIFSSLNERVVKKLQQNGVKAQGFPVGVFGALLSTPELGFVGEIKKANVEEVKRSIQDGYVPILTSLGTRLEEDNVDNFANVLENYRQKNQLMDLDKILNINADVACRELCLELNPVKVIFTSAKGGFLDDDTGEILTKVDLETEYIKLVNKDYTGRQGTLLKLIEIKILLDNLPKHSSVCITSPSSIIENLFAQEGEKTTGTTFVASSLSQKAYDEEEYKEVIPTKFSVRVGLLGARGYVGKEFCKLLLNHSELELGCASSRQLENQNVISAFSLEENYANNRGISKNLAFRNISPEEIVKVTNDLNIHVWVLALPNNLCAPFVKAFDEAKHGAKSDIEDETYKDPLLIDLSSDNRFDDSGNWVYGLIERPGQREKIAGHRRISNPGCYATGAQTALMPLMLPRPELEAEGAKIRLKHDCVPMVFGVSGFSGAGTTPMRTNDVEFLANNMIPYKLLGHIHEKECSKYLNGKIDFTPHVGQWFQGISLTINCYLDPVTEGKSKRYPTRDEVVEHFQEYYKGEELIKVNVEPDQSKIPTVKDIMLKHHVELSGFQVDAKTGRLVIISLIDNLLKGAATQAVQNINVSLGIRELDGIEV